jgi:hypothetical protein
MDPPFIVDSDPLKAVYNLKYAVLNANDDNIKMNILKPNE